MFGTFGEPEREVQVIDEGFFRMQFRIQLYLPREMVEGKFKVVYWMWVCCEVDRLKIRGSLSY